VAAGSEQGDRTRARARGFVTAGAPLSYPSLRQSKWSAVDDACGRVDAGAAATFGLRYVFATLDQKQFSLQTRVNYVLSPKMSLQVYVQLRAIPSIPATAGRRSLLARDFGTTFGAPADDVLMFKVAYWFQR
jgi:hypothetical protein